MPQLRTVEDVAECVTLGAQGRLVIPARLRRRLGLKTGDELIISVKDGRLIAETPDQVFERIRAAVAHVPRDVSIVDSLIEDRKAEAKRENEEGEQYRRRRRKSA